MRLIDADELKQVLKSNCKPELCHDYNTGWCENCCRTNDFEDLIDNAPTVEYTFEEAFQKTICENKLYCPNKRPQGEWIPVSERLPKENGEYLVTREAYIDRENRNMIFVRDIAWFTTNYGLNNGFHKANTVIAWMPLPELYEEGGAE